MVRPKISKKIVAVLFVAIGAMSGVILGVNLINRNDTKRLKGYENAAAISGIAKAKEECRKEGIDAKICDTIKGVAVSNECSGKPCWVVHAHSDDEQIYWASVTMSRQNERYIVIDYLRDTGTHR